MTGTRAGCRPGTLHAATFAASGRSPARRVEHAIREATRPRGADAPTASRPRARPSAPRPGLVLGRYRLPPAGGGRLRRRVAGPRRAPEREVAVKRIAGRHDRRRPARRARGPGRRAAEAPGDRRALRGRPRREAVYLVSELVRGTLAADLSGRARCRTATSLRIGRRAVRRAGPRPRARRGAPRRQAGKRDRARPPRRAGRGQADGLRDRPPGGRRAADAHRRRGGDARLHGARAGARAATSPRAPTCTRSALVLYEALAGRQPGRAAGPGRDRAALGAACPRCAARAATCPAPLVPAIDRALAPARATAAPLADLRARAGRGPAEVSTSPGGTPPCRWPADVCLPRRGARLASRWRRALAARPRLPRGQDAWPPAARRRRGRPAARRGAGAAADRLGGSAGAAGRRCVAGAAGSTPGAALLAPGSPLVVVALRLLPRCGLAWSPPPRSRPGLAGLAAAARPCRPGRAGLGAPACAPRGGLHLALALAERGGPARYAGPGVGEALRRTGRLGRDAASQALEPLAPSGLLVGALLLGGAALVRRGWCAAAGHRPTWCRRRMGRWCRRGAALAGIVEPRRHLRRPAGPPGGRAAVATGGRGPIRRGSAGRAPRPPGGPLASSRWLVAAPTAAAAAAPHVRPRGPESAVRTPGEMSVLKSLGTKIAGLVEGPSGGRFRSEVRPVEIARKLAREMEEHKAISVSRTYVPNEYSSTSHRRTASASRTTRARWPRSCRATCSSTPASSGSRCCPRPEIDIPHRRAPVARRVRHPGAAGPPRRRRRRPRPSRATPATRWSTAPSACARPRPARGAGAADRARGRRGPAHGRRPERRGDRAAAATATSC